MKVRLRENWGRSVANQWPLLDAAARWDLDHVDNPLWSDGFVGRHGERLGFAKAKMTCQMKVKEDVRLLMRDRILLGTLGHPTRAELASERSETSTEQY
jgi:hypothetical protein